MRTIRLISILTVLLIAFSCSKEKNDEVINSNEEAEIEFYISFTIQEKVLKSAGLLKSATTLDNAKKIVVSIQKSTGETTDYTSKKIEIYKMGDDFFSQKLSLKIGDYKLTEFFLLDDSDNTIYVAPLIGSLQAQNVDNPLPIDFSITKDQITSVSVEVLSTENLTPEDFGLVGFPFAEIETTSFLINVSEKGNMDSLLTATLNISSGEYSFIQELEAIANNQIIIKAGYSNYFLNISKIGYYDYLDTLTQEAISSYESVPMVVELNKIDSTIVSEVVTDIDGNEYNTVIIGEQVWMTENLKVTKLNDGSDIPLITNNIDWNSISTPRYCWYSNDEESYKTSYGALYNWETVNTDKLCPTGWHVPSYAEWSEMKDFLIANGYNYDGTLVENKIGKSLASTQGWYSSENVGAIGNTDYPAYRNKTGFSALPGGLRTIDGEYLFEGLNGYWWSSTTLQGSLAYTSALSFPSIAVGISSGGYNNKGVGHAVRCVKD